MRGRRVVRILMGLGATSIMLLGAGCGLLPSGGDQSAQLTQVALSVQGTSQAMLSEEMTAQAAVPPTEPPPVAPPPTQAPPPPTESPYVEGSMVRAPYDPAAGMGEPNTHEDFDGTSGIFATESGAAANSWYADGQYQITFTTRGWWTWYYGTPLTADFYSDIVIINGDECVERDSAGMMIRMRQDLDMGMMFGITCGGKYYIGITGGPGFGGPVCTFTGGALSNPPVAGEFDCSGIAIGRESEYIDAGPGAVNRLGVWAQGRQYKVYINGHHVDTFTENWFYGTVWGFDEGYHALFLGAGQKDNAAVSFDDFSLWKIY
jgi:hypothetical protein